MNTILIILILLILLGGGGGYYYGGPQVGGGIGGLLLIVLILWLFLVGGNPTFQFPVCKGLRNSQRPRLGAPAMNAAGQGDETWDM